ncbi:MAG: hypothetical protein K2K44_12365 [Oscillospiraceae bacterium]|nr:hypothetical protein [Oscillospiraceae bacterium]
MKIKKIVAAIAAAAMAVSMVAVNAFAATVTLDSEYPGGWQASKGIPKSEFEAIGGDVKVVLTVEVKEPLVGEHNHLAKPMNMCVNWDAITDGLTSDTAIRKGDGFIVIPEGKSTLEFVVPESVWSELKGWGWDGDEEDTASAGLYFQLNDCYFTSAELSAGAPQAEMMVVSEDDAKGVMEGTITRDAAPAAAETPAANDAPAADTAPTTSATTGNVPAAVMVSVMAVAGAAAVATKKRK